MEEFDFKVLTPSCHSNFLFIALPPSKQKFHCCLQLLSFCVTLRVDILVPFFLHIFIFSVKNIYFLFTVYGFSVFIYFSFHIFLASAFHLERKKKYSAIFFHPFHSNVCDSVYFIFTISKYEM
jgi:hypothetical protein